MGSKAIAARRINVGLPATAALGLLLLGAIAFVLFTGDKVSPSTAGLTTAGSSVVYVEFGATMDTVWRASADDPRRKERLHTIEHGLGFGIVPSISPDRRSFVYTSLAANLKAVAPDVPAQVWLAPLDASGKPRQIAMSADLLVKPVWSPGGTSIVFRRSTPDDYRLIVLDINTGAERDLASSAEALFPIAFAPGGEELYAARVSLDASTLVIIDARTGTQRDAGLLAAGLTRDWALSPDGRSLAYLEMAQSGPDIVSKAFLIDTASGQRRPASAGAGSDLGPVWSAPAAVTIGQTRAGPTSEGVTSLADPTATTGFDVPLGWSPDGESIVVRSFDGRTALAPGNATLSVLHNDGSRTILSNEEATFLGWTNP